MSKMMKFGLAGFMLLMMLLGAAYGLAKVNVIPAQKMGEQKPAFRSALHLIGLYRQKPRSAAIKAPPDPLAGEKQALQAQRDALKQEQADWEAQQQAKVKAADRAKATATAATASATPDPKQLLRLASIYEQMSPDTVNKIFAKLPDEQVIALLRRMDEKQVGAILAGVTPERAARLTLALSRSPADAAATAIRTAANTP